MIWTILVVLLILAVLGLPTMPYAAGWNAGYWPSGLFGLLLVVLLILALAGRI